MQVQWCGDMVPDGALELNIDDDVNDDGGGEAAVAAAAVHAASVPLTFCTFSHGIIS